MLTGDGTITDQVRNEGLVRAVNLALPGGLDNDGTVTGHGVLATNLHNASLLRMDGGQLLQLKGSLRNGRSVEVRGGGELQVSGQFTNEEDTESRLVLGNGTVRFQNRRQKDGRLPVTFGGGSLFGSVITGQHGKLILSGTSNTTFCGVRLVESGGGLRVSAGSAAVFFGQVFQSTGARFTGTGTKYSVAGHLQLDGTLRLGGWHGYTLQAGRQSDLLDWGSVGGSFAHIDATGLLLAPGTALDISQLAIDGSIRVVAVPEPGTWALMLAGLPGLGGGAGWAQRRRHPKRASGTN